MPERRKSLGLAPERQVKELASLGQQLKSFTASEWDRHWRQVRGLSQGGGGARL